MELLRSGVTLHDAQEALEIARAIKSLDEIGAIELSLKVCEFGMRRMQEAMAPGMTENEFGLSCTRKTSLVGVNG